MKQGFDSKKYLKLQKAKIRERIRLFDKLYIEFGGKLVDDNHAARVLPGYEPDLKIQLLQELKDDLEVLLCINANDIEKSRVRADRMISYEVEVLRLIQFLRGKGIEVNSVVITLFDGQKKVEKFVERLKEYGIRPYIHTFTKGYPTDVETIVSEEGYGANPYIETKKKIVVVSAPGACSGKLATSLSQLYHENKRGVKAGYAKFETFPVWDLPLKHPVNLAYEAATADIDDKNMIDYFHLEKYGVTAVNYNRDLEVFPVVASIMKKIFGKDYYFSPTDMGVNVIGKCIVDDEAVREAAKDEIVRRYLDGLVEVKKGVSEPVVAERLKLLMNEVGVSERERKVVAGAEEKAASSKMPSACLAFAVDLLEGYDMIDNGEIDGEMVFVCGRKTGYLSPVASTILNALKILTRIPDEVQLLAETVLEPVLGVKNEISNFRESYLNLSEVLMTLSICSTTNPVAKMALANLEKLRGAELHGSYLIEDGEVRVLKNLGVRVTCDTGVEV